jgi:hypothetical protein
MELHVAEIMMICQEVGSQHVRFILTFRLEAKFSNLLNFILLWPIETLKTLQLLKQINNKMISPGSNFFTNRKCNLGDWLRRSSIPSGNLKSIYKYEIPMR